MSRTELYIIGKDGDIEIYKGYGNSYRGAILLWHNLWRKYYAKLCYPHFNDDKNIEKLWRVDINLEVPRELRILLASTFDKMMIKIDNLPKYIDAIESVLTKKYFEDNGHFKNYPKDLREILKNKNIIAICWNQTSINNGVWIKYDQCPTCREYSIERSYNIFKDKKHQFLFEYLEWMERELNKGESGS